MQFLRMWTAKMKGLLTQKRQDHEFDEEIQAHLHDLIERYLRQGMSRADAASLETSPSCKSDSARNGASSLPQNGGETFASACA
jgi:hypothetical protein